MYAKIGVGYYCFHYEAAKNPFRLCRQIRALGMKPAIALNPATPISALQDLIPYLEAVTLMSVEPGFFGAEFYGFYIPQNKRVKGNGKRI